MKTKIFNIICAICLICGLSACSDDHTGSMDVGMKEGKDYYAGIVASSSYDQAQSVFVKLDGDTVVIVLYYGTYESGYLEDFFTLLDEMDLVDMEKVM